MKLRLNESIDDFSGIINVSKHQKDVHDTVKAVRFSFVLRIQN